MAAELALSFLRLHPDNQSGSLELEQDTITIFLLMIEGGFQYLKITLLVFLNKNFFTLFIMPTISSSSIRQVNGVSLINVILPGRFVANLSRHRKAPVQLCFISPNSGKWRRTCTQALRIKG